MVRVLSLELAGWGKGKEDDDVAEDVGGVEIMLSVVRADMPISTFKC